MQSDEVALARLDQAESIEVELGQYMGRSGFVVHNDSDRPIHNLRVSSVTERTSLQLVSGRDHPQEKVLDLGDLAGEASSTLFQLIKADANKALIDQILIEFRDSHHRQWKRVGNRRPSNP